MSGRVESEPCFSSAVFSLGEWLTSSSLGFCTQAEVGRGISRLDPSEAQVSVEWS